jgi:hypothetical protein
LFRGLCFGLETLEREGGTDVVWGGAEGGRDIMSPCEIKVEKFEEGRVLSHDFE